MPSNPLGEHFHRNRKALGQRLHLTQIEFALSCQNGTDHALCAHFGQVRLGQAMFFHQARQNRCRSAGVEPRMNALLVGADSVCHDFDQATHGVQRVVGDGVEHSFHKRKRKFVLGFVDDRRADSKRFVECNPINPAPAKPRCKTRWLGACKSPTRGRTSWREFGPALRLQSTTGAAVALEIRRPAGWP